MRVFILKLLSQLIRLVVTCRGVKVGRGGRLLGFPELQMARGSRIEIGDNVILCSMSRFNPLAPSRPMSFVTRTPEARIVIKNGAGISNSVLSCYQGITIGENTMVGAECLIVDSDFHGLPLGEGKPIRSAAVEIGDYVFIGTRSIILKGVKIGNKSVIGAGSVVTTSIPENCVAAGNPARVIRSFAQPAAE